MAEASDKRKQKRSPYTADRGIPGAYEGETVTRRRLFEGGAMAAGGVASALFGLPALGFALGPVLEDTSPTRWRDVGAEENFDEKNYVAVVMSIADEVGDVGKTTLYVRRFDPAADSEKLSDQPYVAISSRCMHLGCPVRYVQAAGNFLCPCHGGVYDSQGKVTGGPPVRPLDRFFTRVRAGRVQVGDRFSLNSHLDRFSPRDPSNHLDGLWQVLYPKRPTV